MTSELDDFRPHPLYYIIASLLVLIFIVCSGLFCWVYLSHRRTQKLIAAQQKRLNSRSLNFYRNDDDDDDDMVAHHTFGHHGHLLLPRQSQTGRNKLHELRYSKSPSLDIKYTTSSDVSGIVRSPTATATNMSRHNSTAHPRIYRLHSADANYKTVANKAAHLTTTNKMERHMVDHNNLSVPVQLQVRFLLLST